MGGAGPHRLRFPWRPRSGHGSHGRTMYYSPGQERPPAGGLVPNLGKKNSSPGWWLSRRNWNAVRSVTWGTVDGRFPGGHLFDLRLSSRMLSHQHSQHTTGYGPCQGSAGRIVGHFADTTCRCGPLCRADPTGPPFLHPLPGGRAEVKGGRWRPLVWTLDRRPGRLASSPSGHAAGQQGPPGPQQHPGRNSTNPHDPGR